MQVLNVVNFDKKVSPRWLKIDCDTLQSVRKMLKLKTNLCVIVV